MATHARHKVMLLSYNTPSSQFNADVAKIDITCHNTNNGTITLTNTVGGFPDPNTSLFSYNYGIDGGNNSVLLAALQAFPRALIV